MVIKQIESTKQEWIDNSIAHAANIAGYKDGFGAIGCDLSKPIWWAIYCRQSLEDQSNNNRLPDYLRTCALEAKKLAAIVPREYILFDLMSGEHLERPKMIYLRRLMAERRIAGVIFPALDRLSREPLHQQIFEMEATHYGIQLQYADAPSGNDLGSQFARTILAHAAKLVKIANRKNNRGGNIGRVVNKNVPAGKTSFGYRYKAEYEDIGNVNEN
jgi:site-specific DNA recombinase